MPSLLPYNATAAERALEAAGVAAIQLPIYEGLRDPWRCPAALLPWLAWGLSVDDWDPAWSIETKRRVIRNSIALHRIKGTLGAIRLALEAMGYGDATVIEDKDLVRIGSPDAVIGGWRIPGEMLFGTWALGDNVPLGPSDAQINGVHDFDPDAHVVIGIWEIGPSNPHWADYWVKVHQPVSRRDADALAGRLVNVAPARCRLRSAEIATFFYTLGDDAWVLGDDIALGNIYIYEGSNG